MAIDIPVPQFDPNPILSSMARQNAVTKSGAEAQFAPYTEYANALSKIAFANTQPAQALATFMSGPAAQYLDKNTINALAEQMKQYTNNINSGNAILPNPGSSIPSGGIFGTLLGLMFNKNKNALNQSQQQNQTQLPSTINQPPAQPPQVSSIPTQTGTIPNIPSTLGRYGSQAASTSVPTQTGTIPNIPSTLGRYGSQAASTSVPGGVGGMTPQAGSEATAQGLKTGVTAEIQNENDRMNAMVNSDNENARGSINRINLLEKAKEARNRLIPWIQEGKIGGHIPAFTTAADDYDTTMSGIVAQMAIADSQGNLTDKGRDLAIQAKAPRNVTNQAFNHIYEYNKGMERRSLEKPNFNRAMREAGADSSQIPILWYHYQTSKPFYNNKSHTQDDSNIDSWEDFYSNPKNIQAAFSPKVRKQLEANRKKALPLEGEKTIGNNVIPEVKVKGTSKHTATSVKHGDTTYIYQNGVYYR